MLWPSRFVLCLELCCLVYPFLSMLRSCVQCKTAYCRFHFFSPFILSLRMFSRSKFDLVFCVLTFLSHFPNGTTIILLFVCFMSLLHCDVVNACFRFDSGAFYIFS